MFSFDLNFEDEQLCTHFHGDNYIGYMHIIALVGLVLFFLSAVHSLVFRFHVTTFYTGRYIMSTLYYLRKAPLIKSIVNLLTIYFIGLLVGGPCIVAFLIPEDLLQSVGESRLHLVLKSLLGFMPSYLLAAFTLYSMRRGEEFPFDGDNETFLEMEFLRPLESLFSETNWQFTARLVNAMFKAKYGEYAALRGMLKNPSAADRMLTECSPQRPVGYVPV